MFSKLGKGKKNCLASFFTPIFSCLGQQEGGRKKRTSSEKSLVSFRYRTVREKVLTCGPPRSREKRKRRGREGNPFSFDRGHVQRRYFSEARGGREKKKSSSFPPFLFFLMTDLGKMKWSRWRRRRKKRSLEEEEEATSFLSSSSPTQRENLVRRRRRKGCWSVLPQEMGDGGRRKEGRRSSVQK